MKNNPLNQDTIVALSTPPGTGAIAVIRLSGPKAVSIADQVFRGKNKDPKGVAGFPSHTVHFGEVHLGDKVLDEVVLTVFRAPHSFTGEDVIEISCHGSTYIQEQLLHLLVKKGARLARAGEFTFRAFMNGKFDLSQAEAVADLISSHSDTSHHAAMMQMRGGFSKKIQTLREHLVNFASLVELELDFSEEDVQFASREELKKLVASILNILNNLIRSFELGNVIKNGVPVCIAGKPNAGKSTLLNALLEDDRAIVSDVPGTTRDTIEDEIVIEGVRFRFIDTAGFRHTADSIETAGIERTYKAMQQASIIIYLFDVHELTISDLHKELEALKQYIGQADLVLVGNKIDREDLSYTAREFSAFPDVLFIAARDKTNLDQLKTRLLNIFDTRAGSIPETIVTNARHAEALRAAAEAMNRVSEGLNKKISGELLASDIKNALHHLGLITGEVTSEDLLANIFGKFCIGK